MTDTWRPTCLAEFFGQERLRGRLTVLVDAAMASSPPRPLPPLLFTGPPGSGKKSLAQVLADSMTDPLHIVTMPIDVRELIALVRTCQGVLLLDGLHDAPRGVQAKLLTLLEFGYVTASTGERVYASSLLTVIGASTEAQKIPAPLHAKFIVPAWEPYSPDDMAQIVASMATKAGLDLPPATVEGLARAAAGSPGYARRLVQSAEALTAALYGLAPTLEEVLAQAGVSGEGLTDAHFAYMEALDLLGGEAALNLLALTLRLHPSVVMELERVLRAQRIIDLGRGRRLTPSGFGRLREHRHQEAA